MTRQLCGLGKALEVLGRADLEFAGCDGVNEEGGVGMPEGYCQSQVILGRVPQGPDEHTCRNRTD